MAIVVVGGHAQHVGKTSVIAGLIARLPEHGWTAVKITHSDHGLRGAGGRLQHGPGGDPTIAISVERDATAGTDSARFLAAGARRSLWVRTPAGHLAEAMPSILEEIAGAENVIFESNSVLDFLSPDLYLVVLDRATADFKDSARRFLGLADAVLLRASSRDVTPTWENVSPRLTAGKPHFPVLPSEPAGEDLVSFVKQRLGFEAVRHSLPDFAEKQR